MNSLVPTGPGGWWWDGTQWVCNCDPCPPSNLPCPPGPPPFFPPPQGQPPWYPGANGGVSFSPPANPPPNPIRGAFWWDGSTLWLFDGAAWVDTATGATAPPGGGGGGGGTVAGTTTEVFALASPASVTIAVNQWVVPGWVSTPLIDTQGAFDMTTKKYTPKVAGVYQLFGMVAGAAGAGGVVGVAWLKNDSGTFGSVTDPCVGINIFNAASGGSAWL